MTTTDFQCPNCGKAQPMEGVEFCFSCRFPLTLIANKYRLESLLDEGGQGAVYIARHVDLERDAERVIKIVKPELFKKMPSMQKRFRREVQLTSALSQRCQHIVRIYDDFGEIPNLGHFYVMEYLQGMPLSDLIQNPKNLPSLDRCHHIFNQLCDAMRRAHKDEIVHRDLKPQNLIIIDYEDDPFFLKVIDFGIAKPTDDESVQGTKLTQGVLGTPEYMAPEQINNQPVTFQSDLYAMGVILYEMLTGETPFSTVGNSSNSMLELMMQHLTSTPLPPSQKRPDRQIPEALDQAVLKALNKKPEERYNSAQEFKLAVEQAFRPAGLIPATTSMTQSLHEEKTSIASNPLSIQDFQKPRAETQAFHPAVTPLLPEGDLQEGSFVQQTYESNETPEESPTVPNPNAPDVPYVQETSKKPVLGIVLGLLAVVGLLIGGWFWQKNRSSEAPITGTLPPKGRQQTRTNPPPKTPHPKPIVRTRLAPTKRTTPQRKRAVPKRTKVLRRRHVFKRTPIRRRISKSRIVPRRAKPIARRPIHSSSCPSGSGRRAWIKLQVTPRTAGLFFKKGYGKILTKARGNIRCIRPTQSKVQVLLKKKGFRPCIIWLKRNEKQVKAVLNPTSPVELGGDDYCKK